MVSILSGVDEIIGRRCGPKARRLLVAARPLSFDPAALIWEIFNQVDRNWVQGGRQKRSTENWRFEKKLVLADHNPSREKQLEKAIARVMPGTWANQIPTCSGLVGSGDRHRNLDLICQVGPRRFEFIELKYASDSPLYAAIELLQYGILYLFYRLSLRQAGESPILDADTVNLRVLAPSPFYVDCRLDWLEEDVTHGLKGIIAKNSEIDVEMDFRFLAFPGDFVWPCADQELIKAVEGREPVKWGDSKVPAGVNKKSSRAAACRTALRRGFLVSAPNVLVDDKGYVGEPGQNLIEGVHLADFESDLRQGDGNELELKFRAVHSSSALAVNTFARFKSDPLSLRLRGKNEFTNLDFERKCPHGLVGRRSPNLDVVAEGPRDIVAIESKCLEHLGTHTAEFAPAYEAEITDRRRNSPWFREMLRLTHEPNTYRWLDAGQLIKHAFGLAYTFPDRDVTLLYVFWEPRNPEEFPEFAEHRAEVSRFAASIAGGAPEFIAMSYPELWTVWESHAEPKWLPDHVRRLRTRYWVSL